MDDVSWREYLFFAGDGGLGGSEVATWARRCIKETGTAPRLVPIALAAPLPAVLAGAGVLLAAHRRQPQEADIVDVIGRPVNGSSTRDLATLALIRLLYTPDAADDEVPRAPVGRLKIQYTTLPTYYSPNTTT